jgi:hypothetical protein
MCAAGPARRTHALCSTRCERAAHTRSRTAVALSTPFNSTCLCLQRVQDGVTRATLGGKAAQAQVRGVSDCCTLRGQEHRAGAAQGCGGRVAAAAAAGAPAASAPCIAWRRAGSAGRRQCAARECRARTEPKRSTWLTAVYAVQHSCLASAVHTAGKATYVPAWLSLPTCQTMQPLHCLRNSGRAGNRALTACSCRRWVMRTLRGRGGRVTMTWTTALAWEPATQLLRVRASRTQRVCLEQHGHDDRAAHRKALACFLRFICCLKVAGIL